MDSRQANMNNCFLYLIIFFKDAGQEYEAAEGLSQLYSGQQI